VILLRTPKPGFHRYLGVFLLFLLVWLFRPAVLTGLTGMGLAFVVT
jgi:hypothetical protein